VRMTSVEALDRLKADPIARVVMGKLIFLVAAVSGLTGLAVGYALCMLVH
jgi:hypothetical protein